MANFRAAGDTGTIHCGEMLLSGARRWSMAAVRLVYGTLQNEVWTVVAKRSRILDRESIELFENICHE